MGDRLVEVKTKAISVQQAGAGTELGNYFRLISKVYIVYLVKKYCQKIFSRQNLSPKKFLVQNYLGPKILSLKKWGPKRLGSPKFWVIKFWVHKIFGPQIFGSAKFWVHKQFS